MRSDGSEHIPNPRVIGGSPGHCCTTTTTCRHELERDHGYEKETRSSSEERRGRGGSDGEVSHPGASSLHRNRSSKSLLWTVRSRCGCSAWSGTRQSGRVCQGDAHLVRGVPRAKRRGREGRCLPGASLESVWSCGPASLSASSLAVEEIWEGVGVEEEGEGPFIGAGVVQKK
jgi:hypothetical protein